MGMKGCGEAGTVGALAAVANAVLDCTPEDLPIEIVNVYWQIKRSGRL